MKKQSITLSPDAIKTIEHIVSSGGNAKVSTSKDGIAIYEERPKKVHTENAAVSGRL